MPPAKAGVCGEGPLPAATNAGVCGAGFALPAMDAGVCGVAQLEAVSSAAIAAGVRGAELPLTSAAWPVIPARVLGAGASSSAGATGSCRVRSPLGVGDDAGMVLSMSTAAPADDSADGLGSLGSVLGGFATSAAFADRPGARCPCGNAGVFGAGTPMPGAGVCGAGTRLARAGVCGAATGAGVCGGRALSEAPTRADRGAGVLGAGSPVPGAGVCGAGTPRGAARPAGAGVCGAATGMGVCGGLRPSTLPDQADAEGRAPGAGVLGIGTPELRDSTTNARLGGGVPRKRFAFCSTGALAKACFGGAAPRNPHCCSRPAACAVEPCG